ncbi:hypothetical protein PG357_09930 [Riemerella anatipestifer]|uniref:hypothetical protein n=1 Tax=Riemerella anatipestifer TaxID=34085 RepID=UPI002A845BE1|nr:hypothetical protein [Riemerella anatipestifer]
MGWFNELQGQKQLQLDTAKVLSVEGNKCKVQSLTTNKVYFKCSIGALLETSDNHLSVYPAVGSVVAIGLFDKDNTAVVLAVNEVERLYYKQETTELEVDAEGFRINREGKNLKEVLNTYQDEFGKLCDEVSKIVVSIGVTPNVPAIQQIKQAVVNQNKNDLNKILK